MARSPKKIAAILENLIEKHDLRCQISRSNFLNYLASRRNINDSFFNEVGEECINLVRGFFLIVNGDNISFIKDDMVSDGKIVPLKSIRSSISEVEEDEEDVETRSAKQVAAIIEKISENFDMRFQISRINFRSELTKKNILTDVFLNEVCEECINFGFFLIANGDNISFIKEDMVSGGKIVPLKSIKSSISEVEGEEEDDEVEEDDEWVDE